MSPEKIHFVLVAYGERCLNMMERIAIPNLNALLNEIPSNLRLHCTGYIYTSREDIPRVTSSTSVLNSTFPWQITPFLEKNGSGLYRDMNTAHFAAFRTAWEQKAAIIFLFPDAVFSSGSFHHLFKLIDEGYRCIITPQLRATAETVLPELNMLIDQNPAKSLQFTSRQGVNFLISNLHPIIKDITWSKKHTPQAQHFFGFYKQIETQGLICKNLLAYPVYLWPERPLFEYDGTYEMGMLRKVLPNFSSIHVIPDSDNFFSFEISPEAKHSTSTPLFSELYRIIANLNNQALHTDYHLRCALAETILHTNDIDDILKKESLRFSRKINSLIYAALLFRWLVHIKKFFTNYLIFAVSAMVSLFVRGFILFWPNFLLKKLSPKKYYD